MTKRLLLHRFAIFFSVSLLILCTSLSSAQNRIVTENALPGTPQSAWDAGDGGTIEGFAEEFTSEPGQTVHFKIDIASATPVPFTVKIYRLGWYQGNGARFIADLGGSLTGAMQPAANYDPVTGKTDCDNWSRSASWTIPANAVPGVYIARMDCPTFENGSAILIFVVKDHPADLNADLLFKTSDATWQAYNPYGGNSFYVAAIPVPGYQHATKISYHRPLHLRATTANGDKSNFFNSEYAMIRWLERNGYDLSYTTDQDMSSDASVLTPSRVRALLSVGHDEYWSAEERNRVETARANGVNLAFFSANEVYWKTRWEDNFQTLVCYKEGTMGELPCNTKCDPEPGVWTGLWRDGCPPAYAPNDGCKPEGGLSGQMSWTKSIGSIKVPDTYKNFRIWKNTSIETLPQGGEVVFPYGTLGTEWDPEMFTETYPAHRTELSYAVLDNHIHKMSLYKYSSGAKIFATGTMHWPWGLDDHHDMNEAVGSPLPPNQDMQQATVNILFDLGAVPATMQSELTMPVALNDILAPTTVITSPLHDANVSGGSVTITGTSADNGGGALGGVEVSVDGGVTWHVASGLSNWTYTFSPSGYGTINIQARGWDESGNVETVGALPSDNSILVHLIGPFNYSVFDETYPQSQPDFYTGSPVELGMKFKSSIPVYVTGLKYYKGPSITGTHIGHLWSTDGTMLAEETFTNETSSGWQTVNLTTPVLIQPNTTYVVSYYSTSGDFQKTDPFFTQSFQNGYLTALASGDDGGNGVYQYDDNNPVYPSESFGTPNYWADVIITPADVTPPTVVSVSPADGATGVNLSVPVVITFNEDIDPATVTNSTAFITGPGNVTVPATVTVNGAEVTITPDSPFDIVTTYTVTLKGGFTPPIIKDVSGNALSTDYTWSFTTGGLTVPVVTENPTSASTCSNAPVSFTSAATGIPTPTVQWQVSTDGGLSWTDIPAATSATYNFVALPSDDNHQYRAVWSNSEGTATSTAATLEVAATITATIQAVNPNICPGDPLQLELSSATGVSPFTLTINSQTYHDISVGEIFRPTLDEQNIFGPSDLPAEQIHPDNNSLELGVKFVSDVDGVVKGIRFYKGGDLNGGTHVGNLWKTDGTLLASATFSSETSTGWQQVVFSEPVAITANTVYVASCFMPEGNYSKSENYFDGVDHSNGLNLTAPQSSPTEPNGVYVYTSSSAFPSEDAFSTNYWVDVIFAPYVTTTTTFNLTSIQASNGCSLTDNPISSVTINVSSTVSAGTVSGLSPLCINGMATYTKSGDSGGTWSSSDELVATVDPVTGKVTALSVGTTTITYTVTGCSGSSSASQTLTVSPDANPGTVSGTTPLCVGATTIFTSDGETGGTWSSSNTTVATVNATTGEVTAVNGGLTNIIYTLNVGCNSPKSSSLQLKVGDDATAGTITGSSTLCTGAVETFTSDGDAGGTWSSSNTTVATVNPTTGEVSALVDGTTTISYTITNVCSGVLTANFSLTVVSSANPGTITGTTPLCIGGTATFTSDGETGGGWFSNDETIATVNATTGEVTAVAAGTTDIVYMVSGCSGSSYSTFTLTVSPNVNAGVVSGSTPLCVGSTSTFSSNGDAGGSWSSSNEAIATVNASTGEVTTLSGGSTDIIYTVNGCNGPATSSLVLTVTPGANAGTVSGSTSICVASTTTFTSDGDAGGTWSSSNTAVATVNATTGEVTSVSAGTTDIIYTVTGCTGNVTSSLTLTVVAAANAGTISGTTPLCVGGTAIYSSNGDPGGSWLSADETIATVNVTTGEVTAVAVGTTDIYYIVGGCSGSSNANFTLTVSAAGNAGTVTGTTPLCVAATSTFTSNGDAGGSWSSSNTAVATVNATTGEVTAVATGTADIIYTVSGCSGNVTSSFTVTVSAAGNAGTVTGTTPLCVAATSTFTSNGDAGGSWSSSNTAVATVNATTGEVTAVATGTADIIYTVSGCSGNVTSSFTVTVSAAGNAGTVTGTTPLCVAATSTFTSNGDAGGTWSSSDELVATVNAATGEVTAIDEGTTDIIYTVTGCSGNVTSSFTLTVNPNGDAGTISGTTPICVGAFSFFTSSGDNGGTWSSSDETIATVETMTGEVTAGKVTGVAPGSATITYTVAGCSGSVSSSFSLVVGVSADPGTITGTTPLCEGSTETFVSDGDAGGSWSSSNTSVATIDALTGKLVAVAAGTSNIEYSVTGCSGVQTASLSITVNALNSTLAGTPGGGPVCKTITIAPAGNTFTDASCNLIARVTPSGLSPVSGDVNTCVTIDPSVQVFQGNPYVQRHYDIVPSNDPSGATATITLYFTQSEFDAYNLERGIQPPLPNGPTDVTGIANLLITQYHGTGYAPGNYSGNALLINPEDANIVWNSSTSMWEVSFDVVGFSGFYAHTSIANTPLPITILTFAGENRGDVNVLQWSTSSEQNSDHFDLERSTDGATFVKVANIRAAGNSSTVQHYTANDNISGMHNHIFYYRLKMVDINGDYKYSNVVMIRVNLKGMYVKANPNPFNDQIRLEINSDKRQQVTIKVSDVSGRSLIKKQVIVAEGYNAVPMTEFINMPGAVYLIRVTSGTETQTIRVVKQ